MPESDGRNFFSLSKKKKMLFACPRIYFESHTSLCEIDLNFIGFENATLILNLLEFITKICQMQNDIITLLRHHKITLTS